VTHRSHLATGVWSVLGLATLVLGTLSLAVAVINERRMQSHRRPGVGYADVTFRLDGGWRKRDLFTDEGLAFQRRAAKWGFVGVIFIVMTAVFWTIGQLT
jgi:hypothetical protein